MRACFQIRALRQERGLTQAQFASRIGAQQNTVSQWESGKRNPPSSILPQLAEVLGCTIDELFGRSPPDLAERDSA